MAEYEEKTVVETQPTEPDYDGGRNWLRLIGMILAAIIIAILLIFAARWIYNAITDNDSRQPGTGQQADDDKLPTRPGEEKSKTEDNKTGSQPKTSGTNTGAQPGSQPTGTSGQLPNSGPAHVAAVFAGSSLAGASLHYLISRKRKS